MQSLDLTRRPATDPTLIYRYRDGLYAADLLTAALVWLDLFTWLNANPSDKTAICRQFNITERPTDVMLTLFRAMGLLECRDGIFSLTEMAREHLVSGSPWHFGPYYASLKDRAVCKDFLIVLRTDKPVAWGSLKNEKAWAEAMEDPAFANQFTAAMDCRGVFLGNVMASKLDLSSKSRFLDIAGGSGIYACAVVAAHPHIHATVLEKPPVDKVARRLIAERGFSDSVSVIAGDMFKEPFPTGYDVHLFSNVLHDWDESIVRSLLEKSYKALPAGGLLVVHDAHLNAEKSGPLHVAEYSALLMHSTEGRCYSIGEMERYLVEAGFTGTRFTETAVARSLITARKKA